MLCAARYTERNSPILGVRVDPDGLILSVQSIVGVQTKADFATLIS